VILDSTASIIARNKSPDISFDQSINPYRGCEHGCIYCFARPTHAYLGMSPGVDFESRLFRQAQCRRTAGQGTERARLCAQGDRHGHQHRSLSALEKKMRITRQILEVLRDFRHPSASSPSRR